MTLKLKTYDDYRNTALPALAPGFRWNVSLENGEEGHEFCVSLERHAPAFGDAWSVIDFDSAGPEEGPDGVSAAAAFLFNIYREQVQA